MQHSELAASEPSDILMQRISDTVSRLLHECLQLVEVG